MKSRTSVLRKALVLLLALSIFMSSFAVSAAGPSAVAETKTDPGFDQYGGWKGIQGHNTTGHWTVELIGDRYWFITPDNNVLWIRGHIGCTPGVEGLGSAVALGYAPTAFVNQAKYPSTLAWSEKQLERSQEWGFNNTLIMNNASIPDGISRCALLDMNWLPEEYGVPRVARFFVDVFDTRYPAACVKKAQQVKPLANDPWTIGVYLGNEQAWNGDEFSPIGLPNVFIGLSATAAGKKYWVNTFLQNRYTTVESLNTAYGTDFHSWDDVLLCTGVADSPAHPKIHEDKVDFSEDIAEAYYKPLAAAVRAAAPRLLVLSERLLPRDFVKYLDYNKRIWKVAGKYCDVFCANSYVDYVKLEQTDHIVSDMMEASGKPVLITEHSYVANDTSIPTHGGEVGGNRVIAQTDRASSYVDYLNGLLSMKVKGPDGQPVNPFMGIAWYKWYDDPALGSMAANGENYNFGILDGMDEAYTPLVDVMKNAHSQVYDAIVHAKPISIMTAPEPLAPLKGQTVGDGAVFSWEPVQNAASYTLLISPEKAFPDEQTIRVDGIRGTNWTLDLPLASGHFWWAVRANEENPDYGGYYAHASEFRFKNSSGSLDSGFGFEELHRVSFEDIWDSGGAASSYVFLDTTKKMAGASSARCVFTAWATNKTGEIGRNDASVFIDCEGTSTAWTGFSLAVRPASFADKTRSLVPSTKYLRIRAWDEAGKLFQDWPLDPKGELPIEQWSTVTIPFGERGLRGVSKIAIVLVRDQDDLAYDQRLVINVDNVVPLTTASDATPPQAPFITELKLAEDRLAIHLDATDQESGIRGTRICVGRTPGSDDLVPWTTDRGDSVVPVPLALSAMSSWYVSAEAQNGAGTWSPATTIDGSQWTTSTEVTSLAEEHGSLTPAGTVLIPSGSARTFSAAPAFGYSVRDILVDGSSVGAEPTVTVQGDGKPHSVVARFMFNKDVWNVDSLPQGAKTTISMPIGSTTYRKNGTAMTLDAPPYIESGRTLVPVRAVSEGLDADVGWNAETRDVTLTFHGLDGDRVVKMTIGEMAYTIDGRSKWMDVVPTIANGRTFLPVRTAAAALGAKVEWDAASRTVLIEGLNMNATPLNDGQTLKELYGAALAWDANQNGVGDSAEPFYATGGTLQFACERVLTSTMIFSHADDDEPEALLPALSIVVPIGIHGSLVRVQYAGRLTGYVSADALEHRARELPFVKDPEKWVVTGSPSLQSFLNDALKTQGTDLKAGQSITGSVHEVIGTNTGGDQFGFETWTMIDIPTAASNSAFGIRFRITRTTGLTPDPLDTRADIISEPSLYFIGTRGQWNAKAQDWDDIRLIEIALDQRSFRAGTSDWNHRVSTCLLRSGQLYEIRFLDGTGRTAVITLPDGTIIDEIDEKDTSGILWNDKGGCFPDHRLSVNMFVNSRSSITISDLTFIVPPAP